MEITSFWPIFFIAIGIQGLFLGFILFLQKNSNKGNLVLALLIALFSISIFDTVVFWIGYYKENPHLLGLSLSFVVLYGPLFYIYLVRINKANTPVKIKNKWLHFVPFIIVLSWYLPYYFSDKVGKLELISNWNNSIINALLVPFLGLLSLLIYAILSYRHIKWLENKYELKIIKSNHWLGWIYKSYSFFVVLNFIHFFNVISGYSSKISDIFIALGYSTFIYAIGYLSLKMSKLLNGIKVDTTKYQANSLPEKFSKEMFAKLVEHVQVNESFKNNEIKLLDLAEELSLTSHQLSQIINQNANQNFSEFINSYRVKEALKLISQIDRINLLAYEVGFNNRTTFNKVFKKTTGLTPTQYKKSIR
nr:helix-turn-helix domain-containing protein [uncultured Psychroserpens sp.]